MIIRLMESILVENPSEAPRSKAFDFKKQQLLILRALNHQALAFDFATLIALGLGTHPSGVTSRPPQQTHPHHPTASAE